MKIRMFCAAFVAAVLLCGCSSAKFTESHGLGVLRGSGGEVRSVDGIDIWENGEPARKFEILGSVVGIPRSPRLGRPPFFSVKTGILPSPKSHTNTAETPSFCCT